MPAQCTGSTGLRAVLLSSVDPCLDPNRTKTLPSEGSDTLHSESPTRVLPVWAVVFGPTPPDPLRDLPAHCLARFPKVGQKRIAWAQAGCVRPWIWPTGAPATRDPNRWSGHMKHDTRNAYRTYGRVLQWPVKVLAKCTAPTCSLPPLCLSHPLRGPLVWPWKACGICACFGNPKPVSGPQTGKGPVAGIQTQGGGYGDSPCRWSRRPWKMPQKTWL